MGGYTKGWVDGRWGQYVNKPRRGGYGVADRRELGKWVVYPSFLCNPEFVEYCNLKPHMGGARN